MKNSYGQSSKAKAKKNVDASKNAIEIMEKKNHGLNHYPRLVHIQKGFTSLLPTPERQQQHKQSKKIAKYDKKKQNLLVCIEHFMKSQVNRRNISNNPY